MHYVIADPKLAYLMIHYQRESGLPWFMELLRSSDCTVIRQQNRTTAWRDLMAGAVVRDDIARFWIVVVDNELQIWKASIHPIPICPNTPTIRLSVHLMTGAERHSLTTEFSKKEDLNGFMARVHESIRRLGVFQD
jgi:hypothetical protein